MAFRATSLKAIFCALSFGVEAITTQCAMRSGYCVAHDIACIPPKLPPITAANCLIPKRSAKRTCALTQSSTVNTGKLAPYGKFVFGLMLMGPVEPKQEPKLFTPITKNRLVSIGLSGPTILSHQPISLGSSGFTPAT